MTTWLGKTISNVGTALKLPELGISEKLGYAPPPGSYGGALLDPRGTPKDMSSEWAGATGQTYNPPKPQVQGASTSGITGGNLPSQLTPPNFSGLNQQTNDYGNLIDQEYNNQMNMYQGQEGILRGQTGQAEQQVGTEFGDVSNQLTNEQAVNEAGIANQVATGEKSTKSALQQARDLYRQTQQQNIIATSGLGISSSSVTEALAERLGVETARRIAGITGSMDEIRQNAAQELTRVKTYFEGKKTTLAREKANQIATIQNKLQEGLLQINSARDMATTAKARARTDLFYNAQKLAADIQAKYEDVRMSLQQWAITKQNAVQPIAAGDWQNQFNASLAEAQKQFNPTQFNVLPSYSVDQYGHTTGKINVQPREPQAGDTKDVNGKSYYYDGSQWVEAL